MCLQNIVGECGILHYCVWKTFQKCVELGGPGHRPNMPLNCRIRCCVAKVKKIIADNWLGEAGGHCLVTPGKLNQFLL